MTGFCIFCTKACVVLYTGEIMFNNEFNMLKEEELHRIHDLTVQVLREKGIMFYSQRAIDIFKHHGFKCDGFCVKFAPHQVEKALSSCPSGFTWTARDPAKTIYVGEGQEMKVHVMQNHGPVFVQESNGSRRYGTMEDVINFYKLGQTSTITTIVGQVSVDPHEVDGLDKQLRITQQLLKHTDKPLMSYPAVHYEDNQRVFNMLEMVYGKGYLADHYCINTSVCALSPLQYAHESADCLIAYAEANQPAMVLTAPMLGVSTPVSPIGAVIAQNAELLAGIVLSQLVQPGVPMIHGTATYATDMTTGAFVTASPELNLIDRVALQLAQQIYHLPTRTLAGNTDAKIADIQAGYETFQNYVHLFMGGSHMVNECIGILDGMLAVSYEKYIIDEEMMDRMHIMMTKLPTTEQDYDISVLLNIPHGDSFLMEESTLAACKDQWKPTVAYRDSYDQFEKDGQPNILDRAKIICDERIASAPSDLLGNDLNRDLDAYIKTQY